MAEYHWGVQRAHGYTQTGYGALGSAFEFVSISTAIPIMTYNDYITTNANDPHAPTDQEVAAAVTSQAALDKLIQIVSDRGQPVIMGKPVKATVNNAAAYTVMMATEHAAGWACTATADSHPSYTDLAQPWPDARPGEDLLARIKFDGVNFGFRDDNTLAVHFNPLLT